MPRLGDLVQVIANASRSYAAAHEIERSDDWLLLKTGEEYGEVLQAYLRLTSRARSSGAPPDDLQARLADEVADLLGMVLLLVDRFGVDIVPHLEKKWHTTLGSPP